MPDLTRSPLAPDNFPDLAPIDGLKMATRACRVKYKDRADVLLCAFEPGTVAAGVFTRSKTASAPVEWCRKNLNGEQASALIVNAGNANAFSGKKGEEAVEQIAEAVADHLACRPSRVFGASTGVIGEPLDSSVIISQLSEMVTELGDASWMEAASAIMTTDTFPKGAGAGARIGGRDVNISGIAKGSGMIAPDMATMLCYVFTDAVIPQNLLQTLLGAGTGKSFNAITVDSDTSTSDSLMLFATGKAGNKAEFDGIDDPALADFREKLDIVLLDLAHQVVKDGEGASKFVEIRVYEAEDDQAAKTIGLSIANSPLVKTAIAGEDANWGRVVMAVGKAGEAADRDRMWISIGGVTIAKDGLAVNGYDEAPVTEHMKGDHVLIETGVGVGAGEATVWTCDFTHGYISINADYRS